MASALPTEVVESAPGGVIGMAASVAELASATPAARPAAKPGFNASRPARKATPPDMKCCPYATTSKLMRADAYFRLSINTCSTDNPCGERI
jgi:hypothetical protein